ncbi:MAG: hypothetical protein MK010_02285 [Erythrobacter sp.]|nr:hypothetical protein [Erythrobacter sp.]
MSDAGFASLSPTLLARKGGARPAMRPQHGMPGKIDPADAAAELEDLGWNDMGEDDDAAQQRSARIVRLEPLRDELVNDEGGETVSRDEREVIEHREQMSPSPVRETIDRIAKKLEANRQEAVEAAAAPALEVGKRIASSGKKRAAFTLRLDPERHLRLRLASTVSGCSAQVLVTQALDAMLADMPEIETLATQVKRP